MELYQLRGFAAVAELGHLTRAAERLHVSQPALSAQIRALEDEFGVALFARSTTGMALTAAGRKLLPTALAIVGAAESMRGLARSLRGDVAGRLRLGTLADPDFLRIGALLGKAVERHPLLEIEVHQSMSGVLFGEVRDGALDASFYYGALSHPAVGALPLATIRYRVAAPAAWRERIAGADWPVVAALPWIMAPAISSHRALAVGLFASHGVSPAMMLEADSEAVIRSLVVAGVGVALLREDLACAGERAGELALWRDIHIDTDLSFIYPEARAGEPALVALRDVVAEVWAREPQQHAAVA